MGYVVRPEHGRSSAPMFSANITARNRLDDDRSVRQQGARLAAIGSGPTAWRVTSRANTMRCQADARSVRSEGAEYFDAPPMFLARAVARSSFDSFASINLKTTIPTMRTAHARTSWSMHGSPRDQATFGLRPRAHLAVLALRQPTPGSLIDPAIPTARLFPGLFLRDLLRIAVCWTRPGVSPPPGKPGGSCFAPAPALPTHTLSSSRFFRSSSAHG